MTQWHADQALLSRYADGATDYVLSASIETHLMSCATCRARVGSTVDANRTDTLLAATIDRIDVPHRGVVERGLCRLGVQSATARLLIATPLMRASWLAAVAIVLMFATISARTDPHQLILFLTIAPLAPVAGVATAFGLRRDPAQDIGLATPYPAFRLLLLRALAVVATTAVGAGFVRLVIPGADDATWAWLLPALALTTATLAASRWVELPLAAIVITSAWVCAVIALHAEKVPLFDGAGQLVYLIIAVVSAAVVLHYRDGINLRGRAS
jgi:hypothetical protein